MIEEFEPVVKGIIALTNEWEPRLSGLPLDVIEERRNSQNRNIKQIVGHMIDSASNNTHRIVHLQYQQSPFQFPNYATLGNNDRWIAIQNYETEEWNVLVQLWKFSNLHVAHVIVNIARDKTDNKWVAGPGELVSLKDMVLDYLRHFNLHLAEVEELAAIF